MRRLSHNSIRPDRGGMAPLEWVLIFPIFLAVLCCAMWVAGMVIGKSETTIEARYNADSLRYTKDSSSSSEAFRFDMQHEGRVSVSSERDFRFSGIMPVGRVSANHTVLLNSWDHAELPMDTVPDYRLALRLGAQGPQKDLNRRVNGASRLFEDLQGLLGDLSELFRFSDVPEFFTSFPGLLTQLSGSSSELNGNYEPLEQSIANAADQIIKDKMGDLIDQNGDISEVLNMYRKIRGAGQESVLESKRNAAKESRDAEERNATATKLAKIFANSESLLQSVDEVIDDDSLTAEDRSEKLDQSFEQIEGALKEVKELAASDSSKMISNAVSVGLREAAVSQFLGPAASKSLKELGNAISLDGLDGLESGLAELKTQLKRAVAEENAAKIQELTRTLESAMSVIQVVMNAVSRATTNLAERTKALEREASARSNSINLPEF